MVEPISIIIPCYDDPHWAYMTVKNFVRYSAVQHQIILVWHDPAMFGEPRVTDWVPTSYETCATPFESVPDMWRQCGNWMATRGVEFVDTTPAYAYFSAGRERDLFCDITWKCNVAAQAVRHAWVAPEWDADLYPGPNWDRELFDAYEAAGRPSRTCLTPYCVGIRPPALVGRPGVRAILEPLDTWNPWVNSPAHGGGLVAMPAQNYHGVLSRADLEGWIERWGSAETYSEPSGQRTWLHFFGNVYRTDEAREYGMGALPLRVGHESYGVDFDDSASRLGCRKLTTKRSFAFHLTPMIDDEVDGLSVATL